MFAKPDLGFALVCALMLSWPSTLMAQVATPAPRAAASPVAGSVAAGALLPQMDVSVKPGADFFRYAAGGW
nr:hypothetical protein [Chloroflexia bacterium]